MVKAGQTGSAINFGRKGNAGVREEPSGGYRRTLIRMSKTERKSHKYMKGDRTVVSEWGLYTYKTGGEHSFCARRFEEPADSKYCVFNYKEKIV